MLKICYKQSNSTQEDSSEERDQDYFVLKTNPQKHKTQLCKNYSELGYCNYGGKCRFAHGKNELVIIKQSKHFRKTKCNGFWKKGYCLYGVRCQFGHTKLQWENQAYLKACQSISPQIQAGCSSKLMKILSCSH